MANEYRITRWGVVDQTTEPTTFVAYLDTVTALETMQQMKRRTYDLLQVREGHHLLDVGCGVGDDVRVLAQRVGTAGRVVGVDSSKTMVAEAQKRSEGQNLPVEFVVGDAGRLEFADNTFDGCRSDRTLQHVAHPRQVLGEMIRVARSGARIVVMDADWETLLIDAPDRMVTRKLLNFFCDGIRQGWIGRQLRGLFLAAGLAKVEVFADTVMVTDYTQANQLFNLQETAGQAQAAGVVSPTEVTQWLNDLEQANQAGQFFAAVSGYFCVGHKP